MSPEAYGSGYGPACRKDREIIVLAADPQGGKLTACETCCPRSTPGSPKTGVWP